VFVDNERYLLPLTTACTIENMAQDMVLTLDKTETNDIREILS